jgi:hypothetical protein
MTKIDIHRYDPKVQLDGSYIFSDGAQRWYDNDGHLHREDGPAIIYKNNHILWVLNGTQYDFKEWLTLTPITDKQKLLLRLQYA